MAARILVATRKGVFTAERVSGQWQITSGEFIGDNANMLVHDARDETTWVALDHGHFGVKLHRRDLGTSEWHECAVPVYPEFTDEDRRRQKEAGEVG